MKATLCSRRHILIIITTMMQTARLSEAGCHVCVRCGQEGMHFATTSSLRLLLAVLPLCSLHVPMDPVAAAVLCTSVRFDKAPDSVCLDHTRRFERASMNGRGIK
jgi:hypothetical protein